MDAQTIIAAIDQSYEQEQDAPARCYIGASIIGHDCDAAIAFNLRGFPNTTPDPQLKRIFKLGHLIEDVVIADLKRVESTLGIQIQDVDIATGKQWTYKTFGGHVSCHTDGIVATADEQLILEIKSMNDGLFNTFYNRGVQRSHPHYFAQVQMYMGMSGLKRTLFIAYNKNRSQYHAEIVDFDPFEWAALQYRIERAVMNQVSRVAHDRSDWRCKGCFKRDVCWEKVQPEQSCTTCQHAMADSDGSWYCTRHENKATDLCSDYQQYRPFNRS